MSAFADELEKISSSLASTMIPPGAQGGMAAARKGFSAAGALGKVLGPNSAVGKHLNNYAHEYDLAGLGILAAPSLHNIHANLKQDKVDRHALAHDGAEVAGLGVLGAPVLAAAVAHRLGHH
jgi:hypothetical protein